MITSSSENSILTNIGSANEIRHIDKWQSRLLSAKLITSEISILFKILISV